MEFQCMGHRGAMGDYPENSAASFLACLDGGVLYIECDIQLNADHVPYVIHDSQLQRLSGHDLCVHELNNSQLSALSFHEPQRLGDKFRPQSALKLCELCKILANYPPAKLLVEIKPESIAHFSYDIVWNAVLPLIQGLVDQIMVISYDEKILRIARQHAFKIALVLRLYDDEHHRKARGLSPDMLICNYKKIADNTVWQGPWQWCVYDISDIKLARHWHAKGVAFIESAKPLALMHAMQRDAHGN